MHDQYANIVQTANAGLRYGKRTIELSPCRTLTGTELTAAKSVAIQQRHVVINTGFSLGQMVGQAVRAASIQALKFPV